MATILVVDDHAETLKPLLKLLQLEGYNAIGAANALQALGAAQQSNPDLILLDVMIPPMDGLTFLMRLREEKNGREIPVIVVSGLSDPQTIARARELGVREHLVKSHFTPEELLAAVKRHLRNIEPAK
jgi:two-component system sensor histidine kinase/response regulator